MPDMPKRPPILLSYPFRPFFLLTAVFAASAVLVWLDLLFGSGVLRIGVAPVSWHMHEMLFGLIPAAIAGFLLTAMSNWTGSPPPQGWSLLGLIVLWLAGRLAMAFSGVIPAALVAFADLSFLAALAIFVISVLVRHGSRRNYPLAAALAALLVANALMHLEMSGVRAIPYGAGALLGMNLITLFMVVIGGRITPAFSANWLRMHGGSPERVQRSERLDQVALISVAAMIPADWVTGLPWLGALVALVAAIANGVRCWRWSGWLTAREPLLWILHLGYAWIVVALLLKALTPWLGWPPTVWLHAMGAGAAGTLIIGVMTRVSLGHTGRPLQLPRGAVSMYWAIVLAGVTRILVATPLLDYRLGLSVSGVLWSLAFALFVVFYWTILTRPRVDGRFG